jgi:hypothetical protein
MGRANLAEVFTIGTHNAVTADGIVRDIPTTLTFVTQESDLDLITDAEPGDFAATYGLGTIWQYDGDEWQEV